MNEGELSDAVIGCTSVIAETNIEADGWCRVAEKGDLVQKAAVFIKVD